MIAKLLLSTTLLLGPALAGAQCAPDLQLKKVSHRVIRFIEKPTFEKEKPEDPDYESIPVYVLQSSVEGETSRPVVYRVDFEDAIANGSLRPILPADGKPSEHQRIVDNMKRRASECQGKGKGQCQVRIPGKDYEKLIGMNVIPAGPLCMVQPDLVEQPEPTEATPATVAPGKPPEKEKAATK